MQTVVHPLKSIYAFRMFNEIQMFEGLSVENIVKTFGETLGCAELKNLICGILPNDRSGGRSVISILRSVYLQKN